MELDTKSKKSRLSTFRLLPIVAGVSLAIGFSLDFMGQDDSKVGMSEMLKLHTDEGGTGMLSGVSQGGSDDSFDRLRNSVSDVAWGVEVAMADDTSKHGNHAMSDAMQTRIAAGLEVIHADPVDKYRKMSKQIRAIAETGGTEMVDVIVRYQDGLGQMEKERIARLGAKSKRSFKSLKMYSIRIPADQLEQLAADMNVQFITADAPVEASSLAARETARLPAASSQNYFPVDPNVKVAVLDSGIGMHSDLNLAKNIDVILPSNGCPGSYRDELNSLSWSGDDGTRTWLDGWVEFGDDGNISDGNVQVVSSGYCDAGNCFRIGHADTDNQPTKGLTRAMDLSGATNAALTYDFVTQDMDNNGKIYVRASKDGGANWTNLKHYSAQNTSGTDSFDLTPFISADTQIRFDVTGNTACICTSTTSRSNTPARPQSADFWTVRATVPTFRWPYSKAARRMTAPRPTLILPGTLNRVSI